MSELAADDMAKIAQGRNDFVHAVFGWPGPDEDLGISRVPGKAGSGPVIAMRTRNRKMRPTSDLSLVRDEAARLSRMVAHVHWGLTGDEPSPWQDKF